MKTFDVYPVYPIEPIKGKGCKLWDISGNEYLDMYGGHAVISIGHNHPDYIHSIGSQLEKLAFYSNSVINRLQDEFAEMLGKVSGYEDYNLFMCNSGAEANENALKLSSFFNEKETVIAFKKSFHGRTSGAVVCTDNPEIVSPFNSNHKVEFFSLNAIETLEKRIRKGDISSVIIEGIQGVGGIIVPETEFMQQLSKLCSENQVTLILDEIQSGYGRTGKFFAHQHYGIKPDMITIAKGMGNGFPVGGLVISPKFKARHGMLGTTFGGNHLACIASLSVLRTIVKEEMIPQAHKNGNYLWSRLEQFKKIKTIRGLGLMIGIEFDFEVQELREKLLMEKKILTGFSGKNTIRLLPPLSITRVELDYFTESLFELLQD